MTIPCFVYTFNSIRYTFQIVLMTLLVRWQSSQPVHNIAVKYDSLHHPESVLFSYSLRANRNMLAYYSLRNLTANYRAYYYLSNFTKWALYKYSDICIILANVGCSNPNDIRRYLHLAVMSLALASCGCRNMLLATTCCQLNCGSAVATCYIIKLSRPSEARLQLISAATAAKAEVNTFLLKVHVSPLSLCFNCLPLNKHLSAASCQSSARREQADTGKRRETDTENKRKRKREGGETQKIIGGDREVKGRETQQRARGRDRETEEG